MRPSRLLLPMLTVASPALAHAFLERASPPVGSAVTEPPRQVTLTFTEGVEPLFSTIEVRNASGAMVPTGKPQAASERRLTIDLPAVRPGEYTVIWHVTSVDTHKTEGSFRFTVK
jgi:methionine-rich copper-binding protein CopC